jgi:hypothetical protein
VKKVAVSLAVLSAALALTNGTQAARNPATLSGLTVASRSSGHPVLCGLTSSTWQTLATEWEAPDALGFWDSPFILLAPSLCSDLQRWRVTDPYWVSLAIFVLGHEAGHADQLAEGKPYDERDADCRAVAKWKTLKRRLGIKRHLASPVQFERGKC